MSAPVYDRHGISVHHGECLDVMRTLPSESVHAIVTDPPAAVAFMGRIWDSDRGGRTQWVAWLAERMREAHRVLKPGGYGLVWALPRTSHWTAWALEDAGFDIRDCIVHLYGSGFPKSLDVGKAIDRARDDTAERKAVGAWLRSSREAAGLRQKDVAKHWPSATGGLTGCVANWELGLNMPTWEQWQQLRDLLGFGDEMDAEAWRLNGRKGTPGEAWQTADLLRTEDRMNEPSGVVNVGQGERTAVTRLIKAANSDAARQWDGWGSALKPSQEMWWLIRKPMAGTVAQTVLEHGTGALNIGATRVRMSEEDAAFIRKTARPNSAGREHIGDVMNRPAAPTVNVHEGGRWPANLVLTHAGRCDDDGCRPEWCPVAELDAQSGTSTSPTKVTTGGKALGVMNDDGWRAQPGKRADCYGDTGGASRFFHTFRWEPKAPPSERPMVGGKAHETVKPLGLIRFFVKLVCAPGGTVLDCFAGTGTTGQAARAEGMKAILIEQDGDHIDKIRARLDARPKTTAAEAKPADDEPMDLLDLLDGSAS